MRTATYESVLHGVAATAGIDPANILAHEKTLFGEYINTAVKLCWDYYPWQEFTHTEKRYFRDEYSSSNVYSQGDEVFYNGKYYKVWANLAGNPAAAPDSDASTWYEVGDLSDSFVWSETGLYYVGARVSYQDKDYLCIAQPDGLTSSGVDPVNFEYDSILPTNSTYFQEIPVGFERYIGYEQTGKSVIGTVLSIHKTDPRYSSSPPVNFREGREGIYIDGHEVINEVWLRYREEAPEFNPLATTDSRIPKFLVPAIKCFAYKSWLIGDGQHEKSMVQDIMGYDLLVKELDRLDLQQERGQAYRITREPYRRINSQQAHVIEKTRDQVAALKSAAVNTVIKVFTSGLAKNAVVTGAVIASATIGAACEARNAVVTAGEWVQGQEAVEGRYLIFPDGYARPDDINERFPENSIFQITSVNTLGSPPHDINYTASWVDINGVTQTQAQAIMENMHLQRGSFWETYGRNDCSSASRISVTASAEDIVKEASVTCSILAFTGTPFRGIGIGFVGGEESTIHEVTVNPSVLTSFELSNSSVFTTLQVGDRVGWDRQNLAGANMIVNGSLQAVSASILENLVYPKNVGEVVNLYGGTGVVQIDFKYNGTTYSWQAQEAGCVDFYLVVSDDTILLSCGATADAVRIPKSTLNLSLGTYAYACKESARSVGSIAMRLNFPIQPNGGDVIGENVVKSAFFWGNVVKYPIAVQGYYPLWETQSDVDDYINEFTTPQYFPSVTAIPLNSITYYYTSLWASLGGTQYLGNYTGTPDAHPAITVVPVTATESNMLNAFAISSCAIGTSAEAEKASFVEGESTAVLGITTGASGILNPLNLNWDALTDDDDGMLYSAQESTNTLGTSNAGRLYYSFKTNYKRLMWLDDDELAAGTYQLKITPFSTQASDGVDIEPYLPLANQLRFAVTNDDGTTPASGFSSAARVQRQAQGNPYNLVSYTVHSATVNLSSSHCQVPVDGNGLVARGAGQDGFSYDHAVARDASNQHISESIEHTFNIVVTETCGIYIYITDGSLAFREEQLSFTKIS